MTAFVDDTRNGKNGRVFVNWNGDQDAVDKLHREMQAMARGRKPQTIAKKMDNLKGTTDSFVAAWISPGRGLKPGSQMAHRSSLPNMYCLIWALDPHADPRQILQNTGLSISQDIDSWVRPRARAHMTGDIQNTPSSTHEVEQLQQELTALKRQVDGLVAAPVQPSPVTQTPSEVKHEEALLLTLGIKERRYSIRMIDEAAYRSRLGHVGLQRAMARLVDRGVLVIAADLLVERP